MQRIIVLMIAMIGFMESLYAGQIDDYSQACVEGDTKACYQLGVAYRDGNGVGQDAIASKQFFEIACDQGNAKACDELNDIDKNHIDSRNPGDKQVNSGENNKIKEYILDVIKQGSAQFDYPMGAMPSGMALGADAEYVAEYISRGMKGEEPPSFAVCVACHGVDGRGSGGMSPDLLNLQGLKKGKYLSNSSSQNENADSRPYSLSTQINSHNRKVNTVAQYTNERFGFTLTYPASQFVIKTLSDNGDGITLYNADRSLELKAYGSWYGDNIGEIYREELGWAKDAGKKVTYKVLKKNWFVLSGMDRKKQTIFYEKTYFRTGKSTSYRLEYPIRDKAKYNSLVSTINKNFKSH